MEQQLLATRTSLQHIATQTVTPPESTASPGNI